jgi:hypothetical protein
MYDLLSECQETLMDIACQKIPCDTLPAMLNYLTSELPSLSFDEHVERLRKFLAMLERYTGRAKYHDAAHAAAQQAMKYAEHRHYTLVG